MQAAWRRQVTRRGFRRAVAQSLMLRRDHAASLLQHAWRTRRRIVREAAPPISQDDVVRLTRQIGARTVALARELQEALDAQVAAKAAGEPPKPLPAWLGTAGWIKDLAETAGAGGEAEAEAEALLRRLAGEDAAEAAAASEAAMPEGAKAAMRELAKRSSASMVHVLRDSAARGLGSRDALGEIRRSAKEWPAQRAAMQASVVRRQMLRTQAAALHAQLLHPPPLPPVPRLRPDEVAATLAAAVPPAQPVPVPRALLAMPPTCTAGSGSESRSQSQRWNRRAPDHAGALR